MKFGLNVNVDRISGKSAVKFMQTIAKSGASAVRLRLAFQDHGLSPSEREILAFVLGEAKRLKLKAVIVPIIDPQLQPSDNWSELYKDIAAIAAPVHTWGIVLPENLHQLIRTKPTAQIGIPKVLMAQLLDTVVGHIRTHGHQVVMPHKTTYLLGLTSTFEPDILELDGMLTSMSESYAGRIAEGKRYWFGNAGVLGGLQTPESQMKMLKKLESVSKNCEAAFLWSEEANPRWTWSRSGEMFLKLKPKVLESVETKLKGNQAIASYKAEKRKAAKVKQKNTTLVSPAKPESI